MSTIRASVNGVEIASMPAGDALLVEGNQYFPPSAIKKQFFKESAKDLHTTCSWKGEASYYDIHLDDGTVLNDAAWYYPATKFEKAKYLEGYVAFYKNRVTVTTD
ncbi:DUF427-domain-containing protein [Meredithblackwellia eburnea MCA 4105]